MKCETHKVDYVMTCAACEERERYMFLPDQHVQSFDAGFEGRPFQSVFMDGEAYNRGKVVAKSLGVINGKDD